MTTKEQERKALEQIRAIVEKLGENSYVGTAFDGCFEIAEENIANDFALSMKDRWESACEARDACQHRIAQMSVELEQAKRLADAYKEDVGVKMGILEKAQNATKAWIQTNEETEKELREVQHNLAEAMQEKAVMEAEIIRLKAKLYDLIAK